MICQDLMQVWYSLITEPMWSKSKSQVDTQVLLEWYSFYTTKWQGHGDDTRTWGPPYVEDQSAYFLSINRNKQSIAIDMSRSMGQTIIRQVDRMTTMIEVRQWIFVNVKAC
jgi:hypothetical protein